MIKEIIAVFGAAALLGSPLGAQQATLPIEFGADAGLSVGFGTPQVTVIAAPIQAIRVGFYANDKISVEPQAGLDVFHTNGSNFTVYHLQIGLLYHFRNAPVGRGPYLRPFAGITGESGGGSSDNQGLIGVGVGLNMPFADRLSTRAEVNYEHESSSSLIPSSNNLNILFGISVFSH